MISKNKKKDLLFNDSQFIAIFIEWSHKISVVYVENNEIMTAVPK